MSFWLNLFDKKKVENNLDLVFTLEKYSPGDEIEITFERDGEKEVVKVVLGSSEDM